MTGTNANPMPQVNPPAPVDLATIAKITSPAIAKTTAITMPISMPRFRRCPGTGCVPSTFGCGYCAPGVADRRRGLRRLGRAS